MKVMKLALLGTAALAAVSVSARADDVSALKAQIEALNARMAAYEAQPAVPAGYSLLSVSKGDAHWVYGVDDASAKGDKAHLISILPTADVPASTTVEWSGYVKGAVIWHDAGAVNSASQSDWTYDAVDVRTKAGLSVKGYTDTAVGEVGAKIALQANTGWNSANGFLDGTWNGKSKSAVNTDGVSGWWKMTPELTLSAVQGGSLAGNGQGWDGAGKAVFLGEDGGFAWDASQLRLAYASGPIGVAIGVEDASNTTTSSALGVAGEVTYAGDMFSAEVNAGWQGKGSSGPETRWVVDAGLGMNLSDMFFVSVAAGMGSGHSTSDDFSKVSAVAQAHLSDSILVELGAAKTWNEGASNDFLNYGGGIYYKPVSQLTIGLEGVVYEGQSASSFQDSTRIGLVTAFSF
ncbi:MAG: hypothetical protein U1E15_12540 [Hyphomicrobiales bacterium]